MGILKELRSPTTIITDTIPRDRPYVLGIDGGGTKTTCVLVDETGKVWGRGQAGSANYQTVGAEAAYRAIEAAILQATAGAPLTIVGMGLGLAGVGRAEDLASVEVWLERLAYSPELPVRWDLQPQRTIVRPDSEIALIGGIGTNVGIAAIAGTGAIVWGRNARGETKRVGGWGYLLGDEGSGYWIARQGLQVVMRALDGRSPQTSMTGHLLGHLGLHRAEDLVEVVYRRGWGVMEIAALSQWVDRSAAEGDAVARQILNDAARELVLAVKVAATALFQPEEPFEVVTLGGAWQSAYLRQAFLASFAENFPNANAIEPRHEAAYGAALMVFDLEIKE